FNSVLSLHDALPIYPFIYLMPRKLTTFTRFCSLCHLDLQFVCIGQIVACDTKTSGGYLLDGRAFPVAVGSLFEANFIFTTFTAVDRKSTRLNSSHVK